MLEQSYNLRGRLIENRIVFQPMEGCDCNEDGSPSELTIEKYLTEAKSGAGIIWMEASAVCPEGRTNTRQMMLTEENLDSYKKLVDLMRRTAGETTGVNPIIIVQLTHSGRQSIKPMIAYRNPVYEAKKPMTDDNIASDEYLDTIHGMYYSAALLAERAEFDGVDVKSCHGYLFQELLSAFNRPGRYGGSYENRTRLYKDCMRAAKNAVGDRLLLCARIGVSDMVPYPNGFGTTPDGELDLSESDRLIGELMVIGMEFLNVTVGNPYYNPHINRPFRRGSYTPPETPEQGLSRFEYIERHIKQFYPSLPIVGSGLSYYRKDLIWQAERLLNSGICDFVGFGRASLAYPMLWRDYLAGSFDVRKCCVACSRCTELMRANQVSGCAVFNTYYRNLYEKTFNKN
ncbi:MAG: flavin oxidoreductase/NADH oxidase [Clostridiales bacterium]|jgi:2,4-dienoyl-CoA reductase-like NADH-dependent reductase (Old Yellow Enzyme family)|nr:flavin oxidoreductase/NADH oxidase [Clostridiales bacterium]